MWKSMLVMVLCGGGFLVARPADGQMARPFETARRQAARPYSTPPYAKAAVSPYVNLGYNANGLSNYQTLIRPLVEEREILARQSAALEQLNQRLRVAPVSGPRNNDSQNSPQSPRRSKVRFMDYSHYFRTAQ